MKNCDIINILKNSERIFTLTKLKIGNVTLDHGLMLAPMAGVTDRYFRRLCAECGAEYTVTEMVSAKALCYEKRAQKNAPARTAELAFIEENSIPTALQLFKSATEYNIISFVNRPRATVTCFSIKYT